MRTTRVRGLIFLLSVMLPLVSATVWAQTPATPGVCYASTGLADKGKLYIINPVTGAMTLIGDVSGLDRVSGLAIDSHGTIYATDAQSPSSLYRLDAATAVATLVSGTGVVGIDGIAFDMNDVLYAAETAGNDRLYTLNPATGAATLVGTMGVQAEVVGLAFDRASHILYGSTGGGANPDLDKIVTINTITGAATIVGSTGLGGSTPDIVFDGQARLLGVKGGGGGTGTGGGAANSLIEINKATGVGSVITPLSVTAVSGLDCYFRRGSAAPALSTSALGAMLLLLLGSGMWLVRRRVAR